MNAALDWLDKNHEGIVRGLADLVAIPSISTDGEHHAETAAATRRALTAMTKCRVTATLPAPANAHRLALALTRLTPTSCPTTSRVRKMSLRQKMATAIWKPRPTCTTSSVLPHRHPPPH